MGQTSSAERLSGLPHLKTGATLVVGVFLMTAAAKVQIPFWPVPMTLHTMAAMAFAVVLGPRMAVAIFSAYLLAGATGYPVFSGTPERGLGLAYMSGPTGGYLLGFLIASYVTGALASGAGMIKRFGSMIAGLAIVYACGVSWLYTFVPIENLLKVGVLPFVLGDLVKITVVAVAVELLRPILFKHEAKGK